MILASLDTVREIETNMKETSTWKERQEIIQSTAEHLNGTRHLKSDFFGERRLRDNVGWAKYQSGHGCVSERN
jgi:hypothetical protein